MKKKHQNGVSHEIELIDSSKMRTSSVNAFARRTYSAHISVSACFHNEGKSKEKYQ